MRRFFDFLRFDDLPFMSRRNYVAELRHTLCWGIVTGAVDGSIAGIVASKTFHASETITTIVWALPAIMCILNVLWSVLVRGRRRLGPYVGLVVGARLSGASIGLTPANWAHSAWVFAAQVALIHLFLSGLITVRTTIWHANYPHTHRARITGRLTAVRMLLALLTGAILSSVFDWNPAAYRILYPLVGALGVLAVRPLRRMRVRGEALQNRRFAEYVATANGGRPHALAAIWTGLRESAAILYLDAPYREYMVGMFVLGLANFIVEPLLLNILTKRFAFSYLHSAIYMTAVPTVVMLLGIRQWAPLFDRVGVLHFRVYNSVVWLIAHLGVLAAMLVAAAHVPFAFPAAMVVLLGARVVNGLGNAGGTIAWNLGHMHFAREHQTELYMGIHVALTGVRALITPFLALLCARFIGDGAFAVAVALAFISYLLFRRMKIADPGSRERRAALPAQQPTSTDNSINERYLAPRPAAPPAESGPRSAGGVTKT